MDTDVMHVDPPRSTLIDMRPGSILPLPPPRDVLDVPLTRRDLLSIFAFVAENASHTLTARELCAQAWEQFSVSWRENGR